MEKLKYIISALLKVNAIFLLMVDIILFKNKYVWDVSFTHKQQPKRKIEKTSLGSLCKGLLNEVR